MRAQSMTAVGEARDVLSKGVAVIIWKPMAEYCALAKPAVRSHTRVYPLVGNHKVVSFRRASGILAFLATKRDTNESTFIARAICPFAPSRKPLHGYVDLRFYQWNG